METTKFEQRMAEGHLIRTGHALVGHYEGHGFERHLVRDCCPNPIRTPDTSDTGAADRERFIS